MSDIDQFSVTVSRITKGMHGDSNVRTIEWRQNAVRFATKVNPAPFRAYECSIKLAPQSAFTRPAILQSQAIDAGA
jgi:hypothetical protein